ncbi:hypothetical protein B2J93_5678 [Marssonina coronariae]|uniref:Ribosomal protein S2 n=1 Tax=Diplocarpon coronariae TaxID=2795749 RepID=A0A218Z9B2_9HELO|nr:hypothetical protein JHW43_002822 [Diplocarpon mali]OWP04659.1 hypothetical protein B2J93_5678 [Marssonina coronariae]
MILRNVAIRNGQKALAAPFKYSSVRSLTNETLPHEPAASPPELPNQSAASPSQSQLKITSNISRKPPPPKTTSDRRSNREVKRDYAIRRRISRTISQLGAKIEPFYAPHSVLVDPPRPEDVTLELLMASQSHLGHSTSLWNPMNQRYIFGVRQGVHIISLETTAAHLRRAAKVVEGVAYAGGLILFVGTRPGQGPCVVSAAKMSKGCHLFENWVPGSITNGDQILAKCEKRAVGINDEHIDGFEEKIAEWRALQPDLVVCLNPLENYILLHECGLNNIPTIGLIDTDADPTWVTYPIPANDDSLRCVQVIAGVLGRAGEEGQRKRLEDAKTGKVTWLPTPGLGKPFNEEEEKAKEAAAVLKAQNRTQEIEREKDARLNEQGGDLEKLLDEL